jgi:hypothetical protein
MTYVLRFWMLGSYRTDARRLRRIELIRGHRLATINPAVRVFSARPRRSGPV